MKNGDILQTVTRDEETLRRFVARDMTRSLFYTVFMVLFSFIILAFINIKIALSSIALLPLFIISLESKKLEEDMTMSMNQKPKLQPK